MGHVTTYNPTPKDPGDPMDGLVEELLRLESAKHKALILIDACAYDASVREQLRLVADSKQSPPGAVSNVEQLLALSQLITLNTRLLQNLLSTTPLFAISGNGYTASGRVSPPNSSGRVSVEV
jgi:hypothetical protein